MKIKINDKVICFPPYISTTWEHVKSLLVENDPISRSDILIITLTDGSRVKIPHLDQKIIHAIFAAHLKYVEQIPQQMQKHVEKSPVEMTGGFPLKLGISGIEGINNALQHNPNQAELPDLPQEILSKIAAIARIVGSEEALTIPKAVENCNCLHCQISRAIHTTFGKIDDLAEEEEVSDEDLRFRLWDITQNGEKLYTVTNPLDSQEQYNVYLGDPIGCTCGQRNCEHVRAVLNS